MAFCHFPEHVTGWVALSEHLIGSVFSVVRVVVLEVGWDAFTPLELGFGDG